MKTILLIACCSVIVLTLSHTKAEPGRAKQKSTSFSAVDSLEFKTVIQPILQKNCSPCHFPGGKMYIAMPFDKGETIINHEEGALKRFKDEKEKELLRQFIEGSKLH